VPSVVLFLKNNVSLKNDKKTYGAAVIACQHGHTVLLKPPTGSRPICDMQVLFGSKIPICGMV
jgi:hypothetical protein